MGTSLRAVCMCSAFQILQELVGAWISHIGDNKQPDLTSPNPFKHFMWTEKSQIGKR